MAGCSGALLVGSLHVTVSPLGEHGAAPARALVFAAPLDMPPSSTAELLRLSFGLTRAEARLLVRLAALLNLRQAAEVERISYETARMYFKRAVEKLGVRSQAGAIERVRQLTLLRA